MDANCPKLPSDSSASSAAASGLSSLSDFELLVSATTTAELEHDRREKYISARILTNTSDTSENSSQPSSPGLIVGGKRRLHRIGLEETLAKLQVVSLPTNPTPTVCIETSQTKSPEGLLSVFRVLSKLTLNVNI